MFFSVKVGDISNSRQKCWLACASLTGSLTSCQRFIVQGTQVYSGQEPFLKVMSSAAADLLFLNRAFPALPGWLISAAASRLALFVRTSRSRCLLTPPAQQRRPHHSFLLVRVEQEPSDRHKDRQAIRARAATSGALSQGACEVAMRKLFPCCFSVLQSAD